MQYCHIKPTFAGMDAMRQIPVLITKELLLEWRSKYAIGGILLYVLSTVFVVYNGFIRVAPQTWNALFWIITLFTSVNAVTKSFVAKNGNRQLYYYTIADPTAVIFSKIIYNAFLLLGLNLLTYAVFGLVAGDPVRDKWLFLGGLCLGSLGMGGALTLVSAIAAKARNTSTLMAILSFPIIIPILVSLIKITASAIGLITDTSVGEDLWILAIIDAMLLALAYLLFPYLWRD
jgi:heme exporter protein B